LPFSADGSEAMSIVISLPASSFFSARVTPWIAPAIWLSLRVTRRLSM
jgi:hypothetical protein